MIIGTVLRYYKTYQGINYIPLTDQDHFCGLVGDNGIGKSSILESFDTFFNSRPWNFNTVTKRSGQQHTKPQIVPIFLLNKILFAGDVLEKAKILNDIALSISEDNVSPSVRAHVRKFVEHRNEVVLKNDLSNHLIIPIGFDYKGDVSVSFFNSRGLVESLFGEEVEASKTSLDVSELNEFSILLESIKSTLDYIYIPREIDPELFTKLETEEIQVLMGESLTEILSRCVPSQQIQNINSSLNLFLEELSEELEIYSYRTPTDRQQNLKKTDVYNLIIQAFFKIRKLNKRQGDNWLEISALSSGEKQKAIIDIAHSLLSKHRHSGANLIIAVDEPESSLHMSACFDQFDALYDISRDCMQVLFSSHWYGFLPTIESGSATIITRDENGHLFDQINLAGYREQIRQLASSTRGRLPYDIRLKSINDFVQSVITSTIKENPFNWLICEGSSEKIYLSHYLKDLVKDHRLRIVPVGGAKEIKRLYNHLSTSYDDFKDDIKGRIYLLSDTDSELVKYDVANHLKLKCKRMVNISSSRSTSLVDIQSNPVSPATEIEDALNGELFFKVLLDFKDLYPDQLSFLNIEILEGTEECCSKFSADLRASEWEKIEAFFNINNNKYLFAIKYCEQIGQQYQTPNWITEIRNWFSGS